MDLFTEVETLKGIGPKRAEILKKAGIRTVRDFFYNLPRDYENYQAASSIREMRPGKVVVRGKISDLNTRQARKRRLSITEGIVRDDTGAVRVVWFNQTYRVRQFAPDQEYYFTGNYELKNGRWQLTSPSAALVADIDPSSSLNPVYVAHGAIKSRDFRKLIGGLRDKFAEIPDLLPGVKPGVRREALFKVHFPESLKTVTKAREYLAYEEIFELLLAAKLNRRENEKLRAEPVSFSAEKIRQFVGGLPFKLTGAQRRAAWDIFQDMEKATPMNRLLQGDVGSGKTMVAAMAAYEAILGGGQVAILAPTAILASQHYEGIGPLLGSFGVKTALLTGATKQKEKLKKQISSGEIDLVIGTHALLTDDTNFRNLNLVVIDEQHRFGVEQRQKLMLKSPAGLAPHLLSMTATPIPRSLQLTVFGDLDVSVLDELPSGRQPVRTQILTEVETNERLYPMMREILKMAPDSKKHGAKAHGQQIYWICKAIEDGTGSSGATVASRSTGGGRGGSDSGSNGLSSGEGSSGGVNGGGDSGVDSGVGGFNRGAGGFNRGADGFIGGVSASEVTSVKKRTRRLKEVFPDAKVEFLHGKMKPAEKDAVMERFSSGEIDILVSTTVVEVGVDVPNATLMVIENADAYGLAQLHQLRGRVGRGASAAYCYLLTSGDAAPSRRLKELEKSCDGFHLAEVDLKMRGPGEIYGSLQHGALDLRIASLSDTKLIARAQADVMKFLQNDENMLKYKELMAGIKKYQQLTTLN